MQPSEIKRKIRSQNLGVRISANNIRDVMREFRKHGIVKPVYERGGAHPRYKLVDESQHYRRLLKHAEWGARR